MKERKIQLYVGMITTHPDTGDIILITDGQMYGSGGGISNFWYWRKLNDNGTLSDPPERGYGWGDSVDLTDQYDVTITAIRKAKPVKKGMSIEEWEAKVKGMTNEELLEWYDNDPAPEDYAECCGVDDEYSWDEVAGVLYQEIISRMSLCGRSER